MILDKGICTIYRRGNVAGPGEMPVYSNTELTQGWYGELNFETSPTYQTDAHEETRCDARIRILQDRRIRNHDRAQIRTVGGETALYEVTRAYHGTDDDSGELITDLTLEVVQP